MKIFHLADTHLGFSAYNKLEPDSGLNQREIDFYSAFQRFVDIALETMPDLILHSGDLFDSVRPTNRAISIAMDQLLRLSKAKIPIVIIAGNHSTPRLRETGSVFRLFEHLDHVYPIYKDQYECIEFPEIELKVHAIPHCTDADALNNALEQLEPDKNMRFNIAMMHAAIVGVKVFRSNEFNEMDVKSGYLHKGFNYIALGHYHEFCKVDENAYYSGSLERLNFLEAQHDKKGFIELDISDDSSNGYPKPVFNELLTRPMVDFKPIDCSIINQNSISTEIERRLESIHPEDRIIRLKIQNLPISAYNTLDFNRYRKLTSEALHFELQYEVTKETESASAAGVKFDILSNEFKEFLSQEAVEGLDKNRLLEMGIDFLIRSGGG